MKVSDIRLEMELNGVDFEDITEILEICKPKAYDTQAVDEELQKRGYEPLFALDYEDDDDDFDDEYPAMQKFSHKKNYID